MSPSTPLLPVVAAPESPAPIAAFGSTIAFYLRGSDTGGAHCLGLATTPPGAGPPLHVHGGDDETFVIVSGLMAFYTKEGWREVEPGAVIYLPRGTPHTFRNVGSRPSQHWVLNTPSGFDTFYEESAAVFARGGPPDFAALRQIAAAHGYEILGPPPEYAVSKAG